MNINEVEFPDKYRPIVRRLHKAVEGKELEEYMRMEDDFQAELDDLYETFKRAKKEIEQARKDKEQARKDSEVAKKELAKTISVKEEAVVLLINSGMDKSVVASKLKITSADIDKILRMREEK
ncbi:MAG: hypothetical protein WAT92_16290 [Saprospiraceae bacterium]